MSMLTWQNELRNSIRQPDDLVALNVISRESLPFIKQIHANFPFSITPYYAGLINWQDPQDPLLRIVAPSVDEMDGRGLLDVSGEKENTKEVGIQLMYPATVLFFPIPACFAYCRFCFRKRLFNPELKGEEILKNLDQVLDFIRNHPTINNVLLTGGDPLMVKTGILEKFLRSLRLIDHVKIIRFGTRGMVFLPSRISGDAKLLELLAEVSAYDRRVYMINHFNHPRELTREVGEAANLLMKAGVVLSNQTVMLKGVNDSPVVIRQLLNGLAEWGITPYYIFQGRPTQGTHHFIVPLHKTCEIVLEATRGLNGLAKRVRLIMSHYTGKVEIVGVGQVGGKRHVYLRYHQARDEAMIGKIFCYPLPDTAYWLDDLPGFTEEHSADESEE